MTIKLNFESLIEVSDDNPLLAHAAAIIDTDTLIKVDNYTLYRNINQILATTETVTTDLTPVEFIFLKVSKPVQIILGTAIFSISDFLQISGSFDSINIEATEDDTYIRGLFLGNQT